MLWSILKVIFLIMICLIFKSLVRIFFPRACFPVLILLVLEIMLRLPIYFPFWTFLFCPWDKIYTATGNRRFCLTMKRFWFFIVLQLIADCSRVGFVIPKHYPHQDCLVFILTVGLTQTCPAILTATIRPLLFGKEIRKNLFVVARSLAVKKEERSK